MVPATGNPGTTAPPADGGAAGFDILPEQQVAKNTLVVGSVLDVTADPYTSGNITVSGFSAFGATDDGRIKPDVVGNGQDVRSTSAAGGYLIGSGTSFASPNVTGTAALLLEHYRNLYNDADPRSATLKGTLIHTAFDAGNVGPDYRHGWGLVDAAAAATFLTNTVTPTGTDRLLEETYAGLEKTYDVISDGTGPLKLTIVWTDPAPTTLPGAGLDDATSVLVNDLDLWVTGPGGTYRPWTLNPANPNNAAVRTVRNDRDNVEQVLIDAPAAGKYTIHVGRDPGQGTFNQEFSLLVSGIDAAPQVTKVWIDYSGSTAAPLEIKTGTEFNVDAEEVNQQIMSARIGGVFDTITIEFSEPVNVQQADLVVYGNAGCPGASVLPKINGAAGFAVNGNQATWKFDLGLTDPWNNPQFHSNQILLKLDADTVFGVKDNPPNTTEFNKLDGDWINPEGFSDFEGNNQFASGNGIGGSDFEFRMTLMRSDLNRDGLVNGPDSTRFVEIFLGTTDPTLQQFDEGDLNSSGSVTGADANLFVDDFLYVGGNFFAWPGCGGGSESLMGGGGESLMAVGAMTEAQRRASLAEDLRAAIDSYIKRFGTPNRERLAELYDTIEELEAAAGAGSGEAKAADAVVVARGGQEAAENDLASRRERGTLRAVKMTDSSSNARRETLRAVDWAMEGTNESATARRSTRRVRALSRLPDAAIGLNSIADLAA
ncbi:MAG: S8 family serine peptidase [Pirellulales bacterium]